MLPKKMRLTRADFGVVAKIRPIRVNNEHFSLSFYPNTSNIKVAAVVAKKNTKKAIARHLIKRLIYQAFSDFSTPKNGWYMFFIRANGTIPSYSQVLDSVHELLKKV